MKPRRHLTGAVALALSLSITGSSLVSAQDPSDAGDADLGHEFSMGYTTSYLADVAHRLGYLDQLSGATFEQFDFGALAVQLIVAGQLVGGSATALVPLARAASNGLDYRIVYVEDTIPTALVVQPGIASVADLKGKTVSASAGSIMEYQLDQQLASAGLGRGDVRYIDLGPAEAKAAFQEGQLDGILTFEPFTTQLVSEGATNLASLPVYDVSYFRTDFIAEHPELVEAYVCGLDQVAQTFASDPAAIYAVLTEATGQELAVVETAFPLDAFAQPASASVDWLDPADSPLVTQLGDLNKVQVADGSAPSELTAEQVTALVEPSFAKVAADGGCR